MSKQLTIVVGLTVVSFMTFGLALSFYRNVLFEETLKNIDIQNGELKEEIAAGRSDLEYYQSYQYKNKYAKESLGKIEPGEKMLIINDVAPDTTAKLLSDGPTEQQTAAYEELLQDIPVIQHWGLYLFNRQKIDQLKEGL